MPYLASTEKTLLLNVKSYLKRYFSNKLNFKTWPLAYPKKIVYISLLKNSIHFVVCFLKEMQSSVKKYLNLEQKHLEDFLLQDMRDNKWQNAILREAPLEIKLHKLARAQSIIHFPLIPRTKWQSKLQGCPFKQVTLVFSKYKNSQNSASQSFEPNGEQIK